MYLRKYVLRIYWASLLSALAIFFPYSAGSQENPTAPIFVENWGNYIVGGFFPIGVALNNSTGELYVADAQNKRILKYQTANDQFLYKWKWGDLSDPDGALVVPEGVQAPGFVKK